MGGGKALGPFESGFLIDKEHVVAVGRTCAG
jgi:hypothetical protein